MAMTVDIICYKKYFYSPNQKTAFFKNHALRRLLSFLLVATKMLWIQERKGSQAGHKNYFNRDRPQALLLTL
jgi:hypothetical protein